MKQFVLAMMMATAVCTTAFAQNKVKNVYASSTKLDIELLQNSEQTVQLNRYFFAGYNTLCLPMSVSAEQLGDLKVERFSCMQQEGDVLNLYFEECTNDGIQAGVPYLIYSPKSQYLRIKNSDAMMIGNQLTPIQMSDGKGNVVTFGSSWEISDKEGRYGIPAQQKVTPLEAVLIKTTAKELRIVHLAASEVTAIKSVTFKTNDGEGRYDLSGRKVSQSSKGLIIKNGKKTVVR